MIKTIAANVLDNTALRYATGWEHAIFPRVLIGIIGVVILLFTARMVWKKSGGFITALLWVLAGTIMVVFSLIPQEIVTFVMKTEYLTRIRVIMGSVSILVLLITFESIRRTHLQEKYALLWVASSLVVMLAVFFPDTVALLRAVTGMEYATAIVAVSFVFLVLVAFHFSISMSAMQLKNSKIAQRVAVLEARLKQVEDLLEKDNKDLQGGSTRDEKAAKK